MIESFSTAIVRAASIEEIVGHRNAALQRYEEAHRACEMFNSAMEAGCKGEFAKPDICVDLRWYSRNGAHKKDVRIAVDSAFWRFVWKQTGIQRLMGAKQIADFNQQMDDPPEFTIENVTATFSRYAENPEQVFKQSVVDLFEKLPDNYKSNDRFKFDKRIILTYAFYPGYNGWYYSSWGGGTSRDHIRDLDRIMHLLDGKKHEVDVTDLVAIVMRDEKQSREYSGEYFTIRWFKNGNAHLWLKRADLVRDCNRILAAHYGEVLAEAL